MSRIQAYRKSIEEAIQHGSKTDNKNVLTGFSGEKLVGTLQRLTENLTANECYLEVGVFQGLTLLSVADSNPEVACFGIDNFAFFDREGKNFGLVKERMEKLNISNAHIINEDYEDALETLETKLNGKKIGVYFIDGPHDYRSQLMCLQLAMPYLSDEAVIIIDDSNYRHVRQANRDFLFTHPEYKLLFESYTKQHPLNLPLDQRAEQMKGWWDGVNIICRDKQNELNAVYPETFRSRSLYENEHGIHASKHPEVIPFLYKMINFMAPLVYRFSKLKHRKDVVRGTFKHMNTYSDKLPQEKFNQ